MTLSEKYDQLSAQLDQTEDDNKWVDLFGELIEVFKELKGIK